jgi:hypothetical protein
MGECYLYKTHEIGGLESLTGRAIVRFNKKFRASYLKGRNFGDQLFVASIRRVAPLQLASKIEDYIVKEFMQFVFQQSKGSRFCECNFGLRGEQKVDVAFIRRMPNGDEVVEGLIEAKYLQNRGHRSGLDGDRYDEIRSTLFDLCRQLRLRPRRHHRTHKVKIRARTVRVYGLIFASYARKAKETDRKKEFFKRVLEVAEELKLQYHDLPKPYLQSSFEDHTITVLGEEWKVTLRGGLWRPKEKALGS